MKLRTCACCGTEYDRTLSRCPHCGEAPAEKEKKDERIPRWMWAVICAVLGLAVVIGFAYFLYSMDYLGLRAEEPAPPPVIEEPVVEEPDPDACTDLTLSRNKLVMEEEGGRVFLNVMPEPKGCSDQIFYSSANETVATVSASGMITAVAEGQTDIFVTCGDVVKVCAVVCDFPEPELPEAEPEAEPEEETETPEQQPEELPEEEPEVQPEPETPLEMSLSSEDFTLFYPGEETTLKVKNAPEGAVISYVSSDPTVATVSENGLVTAVGSGTADITVTVGGQTLTCIARCNMEATTENNEGADGQPAAGNYTISSEDVTLFRAGEVFYLSLSDEAGDKANGVSWVSADASVCTVNGNGQVTAVGKGTTTVTTTYGGKTYNCIVRCSF